MSHTDSPPNRFVSDKFQALLVDHRGHGESGNDFPLPHTVEACAEDAKILFKQLRDEGVLLADPSVIVGHSFGGKVSLKLRDMLDAPNLTWILDSAPAPINPKLFDSDNQRESVVRLKRELATLPEWKTKAELVKLLTDRHFSQMVAQWMTTNVAAKADGTLGFVFDLQVVNTLFDDYCRLDMFPQLAAKNLEKQVHFLRAAKNRQMWTETVLESFATYVDKDTVHLHSMNAGHFVHAEDPDGVYALMKPTLDRFASRPR